MYKNSGAKIKGLATTITTLSMIGSILFGLVIMLVSESVLVGLILAVVGCFVGWLCGLTLAGFGELIENTYYIRQSLSGVAKGKEANMNTEKSHHDHIKDIMEKYNVPYGEAEIIAKREKMNGMTK